LIEFAGRLYRAIELANFVALVTGHPRARRCVAETLLKVDLEINDPENSYRPLYFQYMNIMVVWQAVGTSLSKVFPFFDFTALKSIVQQSVDSYTQTIAFVDQAETKQELCPICGTTDICMPVQAVPCKCCIYCYHCLAN
jgi:hypothetical protein